MRKKVEVGNRGVGREHHRRGRARWRRQLAAQDLVQILRLPASARILHGHRCPLLTTWRILLRELTIWPKLRVITRMPTLSRVLVSLDALTDSITSRFIHCCFSTQAAHSFSIDDLPASSCLAFSAARAVSSARAFSDSSFSLARGRAPPPRSPVVQPRLSCPFRTVCGPLRPLGACGPPQARCPASPPPSAPPQRWPR